MDARSQPRSTLLYIGGLGRSGSTLLERMLGQWDDTACVGELQSLWASLLDPDRMCGCGRRLTECTLWSSLAAVHGIDPRAGRASQERVDRLRYLPLLLAPWLWPAFHRRLRRYVELLEGVYLDIREHSQASVVVDSSKSPSTALVLRRLRGTDLRIVNVVRDSRGTAYSWAKRTPMEPAADSPPMAREPAARVGLLWTSYNLIFGAFRLLGVPVLRVHYEDLVAHPREQLARVAAFAGLELDGLDFVEGTTVRLDRVAHTVAGNPMRFQQGWVSIALDDEWRDALPAHQRRLVTLLTLPGLLRNGYLLGRRGRRAAPVPPTSSAPLPRTEAG